MVGAKRRLPRWLGLLVLLAGCWSLPLAVSAQPVRAQLATMAPGDEFWSVFGHNALIVEYADRPAQSFNFGYFDFNEPGFLRNFLFGRMQYLAVRLPADRDLGMYLAQERSVRLQTLALDAAQLQALVRLLENHARPENARYFYDYFRNNCSTKLRDALDDVTGGALKRALQARSHGYNFRGLALAQSGSVPWMYAGMHAGLGRVADRPLAIWDETYVPALLMEALRDVRLVDADGAERPLVSAEQTLGDAPMPPPRVEVPLTWPWFLLAGLLWALLLWAAPGLAGSGLACFSASLLTLGGALLVFFWFFSAHWAAAGNQNLVLFNPLYLALLALWTRKAWRAAAAWYAGALFALGAFGSFLKVLPAFDQQNLEWVLLLLPVQWAIWQRARQRRAAPLAIADCNERTAPAGSAAP